MEQEPEVCRLCLASVNPAAVVVLNQAANVIESILQITTIDVILDPSHRVFMCDQCQNLLDLSVQFRTMCLQNDETFRKMHAKRAVSLDSVKQEPCNFESEFVQCKLEDESQHSEMLKNLEPQVDIQDQEHEDQSISNEEKPNKPRKRFKKRDRTGYLQTKVQCQTCGAFVNRQHLSKHQLIHDADRPMFACEQCPKKYTELRKLKEHVTIVHEGHIDHTCDRCGRTFYRWETLRQHYLGEHTNLKKYECKICGEKFARSANRDYHFKMNHTNAKPFACEYCDKSFKRSGDLTLHIRTHTGEKPFKCDLCDKTFAKSYNVVIHKKSHKNADLRRDATHVMAAESAGPSLGYGVSSMQ